VRERYKESGDIYLTLRQLPPYLVAERAVVSFPCRVTALMLHSLVLISFIWEPSCYVVVVGISSCHGQKKSVRGQNFIEKINSCLFLY